MLYHTVMVFAIHQHESATRIHVLPPHPDSPSTSLSTLSLWVDLDKLLLDTCVLVLRHSVMSDSLQPQGL